MPTDPFVPSPLGGRPRQQQNFAPGIHMPPARGWWADRPGDSETTPAGPLTGTPGPNVGFGLTLARRAKDRIRLDTGEHAEDATAVVAELAMKRAAGFGRAPIKADVDVAIELLGYGSPVTEEIRRWRPALVRGADHDYVGRRAIADAVPWSVLRLGRNELGDQLRPVRAALAAAATAGRGDTTTTTG
ncbi:MAG: hypothetical protein ACXVJ7_02415 [Acidimicrobiia bacterium]